MIQKVHIFGYKMASKAVNALQAELGLKQILHEGSHYKGSSDKTVINYGASFIPETIMRSRVLNKPDNVQLCVDKRKFFTHLLDTKSTLSTPDWTTDPKVAKEWLDKNNVLIARTILTGHSGNGIKILRKGVDFVEAPLYTMYIPKQYEYRVHILNEEVIDIQRKVLQKDVQLSDEEKKIRSHSNGWVFSRNPELLNIPCQKIQKEALLAIKSVGLQFGAVDLIWSRRLQNTFVLEVNSAPGLEGASIAIYGEAFRKWLNL